MSRSTRLGPGHEPPRRKEPAPARVKKRGLKVIPKEAKLVPGVLEQDYFSPVTGVYYHFKKMEWRTICKDPFNASKRSQKTFGINKYGFYEAKKRAEAKAFEVSQRNQLSRVLSRYNVCFIPEDLSLQETHYGEPCNLGRTPLRGSNPYFSLNRDVSRTALRASNASNAPFSAGHDPSSIDGSKNYSAPNSHECSANLNACSCDTSGVRADIDLNGTIVDPVFCYPSVSNGALNHRLGLELNLPGCCGSASRMGGKDALISDFNSLVNYCRAAPSEGFKGAGQSCAELRPPKSFAPGDRVSPVAQLGERVRG